MPMMSCRLMTVWVQAYSTACNARHTAQNNLPAGHQYTSKVLCTLFNLPTQPVAAMNLKQKQIGNYHGPYS